MTYTFQTFSVGEVLAASKMNQLEVNVRDHQHGISAGVSTVGADTVDKTQLVDDYANSWVFIQKQTASASATIDFTLPSGYERFILHICNAAPATDGVYPMLRLSDDNGATYEADASDYGWQANSGYTSSIEASGADTKITLFGAATNTIGNATGERVSGQLTIDGAFDSTPTMIGFKGGGLGTDGIIRLTNSVGMLIAAVATQAIRFMFSSGNIASGTFVLYGLRTDQT